MLIKSCRNWYGEIENTMSSFIEAQSQRGKVDMLGVLLWGLRRHHQGYSRQIQLISSGIHPRLFLLSQLLKTRKLFETNLTLVCKFSLEVLHVSWQGDNSSQPERSLKSLDIECNKVFQLNIPSCVVQCSSFSLCPTLIICNFFAAVETRRISKLFLTY